MSRCGEILLHILGGVLSMCYLFMLEFEYLKSIAWVFLFLIIIIIG